MQKFVSALFIHLVITITTHAQDFGISPQNGSSQQSLNPKSSQTGGIGSNVNLYTGDINFPVSLGALRGRNGLEYNLSISYSSNVHRQANTSNEEANTGVVGLGWALEYPRILVDNKATGTREDDTYYINESGGYSELIYVGINSGIKEYKTVKSHQFWDIKYFSADDKWEVIKEDGTKFVYGDKNSGRSTIQWIVKWTNWIGNSYKDGSQEQQQQALIWNLSEVKNIWGEVMLFSYLNFNQKIGGVNGKEQTEASYLSAITNMYNQSINLIYADKSDGEYIEPHTENGINQIDSYQEFYERKFLDYVTINDADGFLFSKTDLTYTMMGTGNMMKRLLSSVTQFNNSNQSLPGYRFIYTTTYSFDTNFGALSSVTMPTGGKVNFDYGKQFIGSRNMRVPEITGYAEPKIWMGNDYVVVTRRQLNSGNHSSASKNVILQIFNWDGEWIESTLGSQNLGGIEMIDSQGSISNLTDAVMDYQNFLVTIGQDFFGVAYRSSTNATTVKLFKKDFSVRNGWTVGTFTENNIDGWMKQNYQLVAGSKFIALAHKKGNISTFQWDGGQWVKTVLIRNTTLMHNPLVAGPGYLISHKRGTPDQITFHFLKEDGSWLTKDAPSLPDNSTAENSYWAPSPSFAFIVADDNDEHIYNWDENFNFSLYNTGQAIPDNSFVNIMGNNLVGLLTTGANPIGYYFDYNGVDWNYGGAVSYAGVTSIWGRPLQSYGENFIIGPTSSGSIQLIKYQANSNPVWTTSYLSSSNSMHLYAGRDYFVASELRYSRKPDGSFQMDPYGITGLQKEGGSPSGNNEGRYAWHGGTDYLVKSKNMSLQNVGDLLFVNMKNRKINSSQVIDLTEEPVLYELDYFDPTPVMAMGNTFVTFLSEGITGTNKAYQKNAKSIMIHRVIDGEGWGSLVDFPVKKITQVHGDRTVSNYYEFKWQNAIYDASGTTCQYNKVITYPGVTTASTVNGSTENYFFNGILSSPANNFPNGPLDYDNYNNLIKGLSYRSDIKNSQGNIVSTSLVAPTVFEKIIRGTRDNGVGSVDSVTVGKAFYLRNYSSSQTLDGITQTTTIQTNELNGQPSSVTSVNLEKTTVVENKYWFQEYDQQRTKNILTPVI